MSRRLALLLALAALPAGARAEGPKADAAASLAPAVTVARAAERELVERAVVTGTLVARDEILVAPEIEGFRITEILVEEGDRVARGAVLARLSREMLDAQRAQNAATIARAEASIAQAESQIVQSEAAALEATQSLERARLLMKSGNFTEAVLEQRVSTARSAEARLAAARQGLAIARAERAQAEAQGREIELRLARTEIRAPEGGIVHRRTARVGAAATAVGEPLFRLIARGEIELEGEVTETQMPRMRVGAPAAIELDGRRVEGRVRAVYPEIDRATRLGRVRVSLPAEAGLRIGAFARGAVEVARRTGVAVPISSVVYASGGGASVLAVAGERVESRPVTTGLQAEGFIEVRQGVAAGEPVVARAGSFLRHGDRVRPILPAEASAAR